MQKHFEANTISTRETPVIGHITQGSVFDDPELFDPYRAAELKMRAELLRGLKRWLKNSGQTQVAAAKVLGVTQARVSDIKRGKIAAFSLDLLVRLAARAGLDPQVKLAA